MQDIEARLLIPCVCLPSLPPPIPRCPMSSNVLHWIKQKRKKRCGYTCFHSCAYKIFLEMISFVFYSWHFFLITRIKRSKRAYENRDWVIHCRRDLIEDQYLSSISVYLSILALAWRYVCNLQAIATIMHTKVMPSEEGQMWGKVAIPRP